MSSWQTSTARTYINLLVHKAELPFSDAILVGDTSYLSGQIGIESAINELTPKHKKFTADLKC
jgi:enamine deaminase RidA (YjgF/YER057c/UK114 family)